MALNEIVPGGSSGIGFGVAQAAQALGASVTIASHWKKLTPHWAGSVARTKVTSVLALALEDAYSSFDSKFWGLTGWLAR